MENNNPNEIKQDPFHRTIRNVAISWPNNTGPNHNMINRYAFYYLVLEAVIKSDGLKQESDYEFNLKLLFDAVKTNSLDNYMTNVIKAPVNENTFKFK